MAARTVFGAGLSRVVRHWSTRFQANRASEAQAPTSQAQQQVERAMFTERLVDLPSLIVQGLSAAVVVYLVGMSGLPLVETGGAQALPDPHALMLSCLVAAVFSDTIWLSVQQRLLPALAEQLSAQISSEPNTAPPTVPPGNGTEE